MLLPHSNKSNYIHHHFTLYTVTMRVNLVHLMNAEQCLAAMMGLLIDRCLQYITLHSISCVSVQRTITAWHYRV